MNAIPFETLSIYEFFCDTNLIDKVMPEVIGPNIVWETNTEPNSSTPNAPALSRHGYFDDKTPFYQPDLFNWIQECVDKVSEKHFNNLKLSIVDSWLTKNQFGDRPVFHSHKYSIVSGLLYFSTFKNSKTLFKSTDPWRNHLPIMPSNENEFSVTPEKGKLIIWRSDILHTIQPHSDIKNTRYTLAFNTFFDDAVSTNDTAQLKLKVLSVKDQYEEYIKKKAL
jgi:hypothetical protein